MDDEINSLRCILRSDDDLQIHSSGSYENVRIKLDYEIQLSFLFDFLSISSTTLTLGNVHDLRLTKISSKCPLTAEQWQTVQKDFQSLKTRDDPNNYPIRSIVQELQDRLLHISTRNPKTKSKKASNQMTDDNDETLTSKFRGADLIFNRILHDPTVDRSKVLIGYEDRFTGIHEIPFNEFKKVHDHEYGVPMHRIRHYKINGKIVWDRTKKFDIMTGNEIVNNAIDESNNEIRSMTQGVYQFDSSSAQWVLCPQVLSLETDDPRTVSTKDVCLPERAHFLTWNVLFDYFHADRLHTETRYVSIVETLEKLLPDIICLQEVTIKFLLVLLNQPWLGEHNYFVTIMGKIFKTDDEIAYGQITLSKNFRPRSFDVLPMNINDELNPKKSDKQLLITRFGLSPKVTIDLVNLHLHSSLAKNGEAKRCQTLENLLRRFQNKNYLLVGDFNFGDSDEMERNLLKSHQKEVHDLWCECHDLEHEPGITFDPSVNICAEITSRTKLKRRFDRYLIHNLNNLSYSIDHMTMIGKESIPIDPMNRDADKRIHPSDHYGLQLILNFQTRSISHRSAFALIPPVDQWASIEPLRQKYDPSYERWPPHINVLWPFFDLTDSEDDQDTILLPLRLVLMQQAPFHMTITSLETFNENNVTYMKPDNKSNEILEHLFERLKQLFPACCVHQRNQYKPHLTIGQSSNENSELSLLKLDKPFEFTVNYLYILQRPHDNDTSPFHISYQLPLGAGLQRLRINSLPRIDPRIQEFFQTNNLYGDEETFSKQKDKFDRLGECFRSTFNDETLKCFKHKFLSYGSFRYGIDGNDLDTVFLLREEKSQSEDRTEFDASLSELKSNRTQFTDQIASILESLIEGTFHDEIEHFRKIRALFPIFSIEFKDQSQVEIFIDIQLQNDENTSPSIHGVFDNERVLNFCRSPVLFQHVCSFVRRWAKNVGVYGQVYGYLGGFSWSILCAIICHNVSCSIDEFQFDQFFDTIRQFFWKFSRFNWSSDSIDFNSKRHQRVHFSKSTSIKERGVMRIYCPSSNDNSARTTIRSTQNLIVQSLEETSNLFETVNTTTTDEKYSALENVLKKNCFFPSGKARTLLELKIKAENQFDLLDWSSWVKSRLVPFFDDLNMECNLNIEPSNKLERRTDPNEIFYLLAFQTEQEDFATKNNFQAALKKFFGQSLAFKSRNKSMDLTHRLVSIEDWKLEQMKPKPARQRK